MNQNILDELAKLKDLLEAGDISKSYYDEQRANLVQQSSTPSPSSTPPTPSQTQTRASTPAPTVTSRGANQKPVESAKPTTWQKYKFLFLAIIVFTPAITILFIIIARDSGPDDVDTRETSEEYNDEDSPTTYDTRASASSKMGDYGGFDYSPANAIDGDLETWWSPKSSVDPWLKVSFGQQRHIDGIGIHGGSHYPSYFDSNGTYLGDLFDMNYRIASFRCEFSDGTSVVLSLRDKDKIQFIRFGRSVETSWVRIVPLNYFETTKWKDVCISEVKFIDM